MFKARPGLTAGCLFLSLNVNAQVICSTPASDSDGDGWGWENDATCIVSSDTMAPPTQSPTETPTETPTQTQQGYVIALEDGTSIDALSFSDADISNGYAIVTPADISNAGSIYSRSGDTRWTQQASLSIPDFELPDSIEQSRGVFAINDKYAVVGVPDYYASFSGSAHIFERISDNQWVLDTVLDGQSRPFDFFGKSVAISNDTIAIGSNPGGEAEQLGSVAIYTRTDNGWTLDQIIDSGSLFGEPDRFGDSIQLNENFLVVSHDRRGATNADIYQRNSDGWQLHSVISGEIFALNQNTIVATEPGLLRTYVLDENNSFQEEGSIEYPDRTITSLAQSEQSLLVAFSNQSSVHHYLKSTDLSWQYAGAIDGMPSTPVTTDRLFLTIHGISDQSVIISRGAFPESNEPFFDSYIVDLPGNDTDIIVSDTSNTDNGTEEIDTIGQVDENIGIDENTTADEQGVSGVCIDNDGDGYGWNGIETCFPNGIIPVHNDQPLACIDNDGDGYGWDGFQSCLTTPTLENAITGDNSTDPVCFDADGDGYGWTGTQSCSFNGDGSITLL